MSIVKKINMIDVSDWDELVSNTYGRIYCFQQQDGCKSRGVVNITIPDENWEEDEMNDKIPEVINDARNMGVKFDVWLNRNPKSILNPSDEELRACNYFYSHSNRKGWCEDKGHISMFWERNFYPCLQSVANDLHKKGLIEAGDYSINIDW
jgi:hypothetical protein